jgi:beta-phosphoglucomutase
MKCFDAAIFDLDGVLADSAAAHFVAWKRIADTLGVAFDETANEALKGVDRMGSLRHVLNLGNIVMTDAEMTALAARKNDLYLEAVALMTPADVLPGAERLIADVKAAGMGCAVASASRNARTLLTRLGIVDQFDFIADASAARSKPAPDIFLTCADALGVAPDRAVGFEDAVAGIEAIHAAGMFAVGIGDAAVLTEADLVFPTTASVKLDLILKSHER